MKETLRVDMIMFWRQDLGDSPSHKMVGQEEVSEILLSSDNRITITHKDGEKQIWGNVQFMIPHTAKIEII